MQCPLWILKSRCARYEEIVNTLLLVWTQVTDGNSRLGGVVACEILVAEAFAAVVADEGAGLSRLEGGDLGLGLILVLVVGGLGRLKLLQRLVLGVFEELQRALDLGDVSVTAKNDGWSDVMLTASALLDGELGTGFLEAHFEELL